MSDALRDLTELDVTAEYVERRVADWINRIEGLYALLETWLPDQWTSKRVLTVPFHEELMEKFGIPPREIPVLDLARAGIPEVSVKPRGLWIIGANGRLDLRSKKGTFLIMDRSPAFSTPSWQVAPLGERTHLEPLTKEKFREML
jgi:hypothetical protein